MKKVNLLKTVFGVLTLVIGLNSCKKCQTCRFGSYSDEVCQDDFGSKALYKAYIKYLEAYGYKCK
jgi:hypothetical protein